MGLAKTLLRVFVDTTVICAIILFMPGLPPYGDFEVQLVSPTPKFEGNLSPGNYELNNVEKLFEGELVGPECLEVSPIDPDVIYTSLQGGAIVKIFENGSKMKAVAKFGDKCGGHWDARKCGRPLGIRFDKDGHLIASDSYYGIFKVDFDTGETINLVPKDTVVDGKVTKIFNSVAPAKDGKIYYTDSSTNYFLDEAVGELLGAPSGRLLVFDPEKNESVVLKDHIHFTNGIVLSPAEDYLIFAETLTYRLLKYWITGSKAGTTEIFVDSLPGSPDNLNFSPEGNILVSLVTIRLPDTFNPTEFMYTHPWLRKLVLRVLHILKAPLELASTYLDLPITKKIKYHILNFETLLPVLPPSGIIMEVDWSGNTVKSWHSNRADLRFYSEAKVVNGYMYLASPYNDYLGRLKVGDVDQPLLTLG